MKADDCVAGALVKPVKGGHKDIGVVTAVNGDTCTVMFSSAGADHEVSGLDIQADLEYPNVTSSWVSQFVTLNQ